MGQRKSQTWVLRLLTWLVTFVDDLEMIMWCCWWWWRLLMTSFIYIDILRGILLFGAKMRLYVSSVYSRRCYSCNLHSIFSFYIVMAVFQYPLLLLHTVIAITEPLANLIIWHPICWLLCSFVNRTQKKPLEDATQWWSSGGGNSVWQNTIYPCMLRPFS